MTFVLKMTRLEPAAWRFVAHMALACSAILMLAGADLLAPLAAFGPR